MKPNFHGRLVVIGFGSIGQGVLPLLLRHIEISPARVLILAPDLAGREVADAYGVTLAALPLGPSNFQAVLAARLSRGDLLLNLSIDVCSLALIEWCQQHGVLYLDTCLEPWAGGYIERGQSPAQRTNYALRESALALRSRGQSGPTALLTHGANPGLASHFVKKALLDIASGVGAPCEPPTTREQWAGLARRLGVKVIHIAERDTQVSALRKTPGEFVNTWSAEAFVDEARQPAEIGWGNHERRFPLDGLRHVSGSRAAIYLNRPGASTRVRTWTPRVGAFHGFLITHAEAVSIADYFTLGDCDHPAYRPTVHYAYHPCDDAVLSLHELAGNEWRMQPRQRVMKAEITEGMDELGVLLMGHARGAYWYGSQLSIEQARRLCPHNSATSLQVTAAVMAGAVWMIQNPDRGITEPDDLPFDEILALSRPYLGDMVGVYSDWTPLAGRNWLFDESVDRTDPWQFMNFRVN